MSEYAERMDIESAERSCVVASNGTATVDIDPLDAEGRFDLTDIVRHASVETVPLTQIGTDRTYDVRAKLIEMKWPRVQGQGDTLDFTLGHLVRPTEAVCDDGRPA